MKPQKQIRPVARFTLAACASLLLARQAAATARPLPVHHLLSFFNEEEKPLKNDKKTGNTRTFAKLNNEAVKIYPDPLKRDMHVVAKNNEGREISFFVFDVEGTLVQHFKMQPRDHNRISGLKRGVYVYRVFSGDEESAAGKFEIR